MQSVPFHFSRKSLNVHYTFRFAHFQQGIEEECCLLVQIYNISCCEVEERALMLVEIHREIHNQYARVCLAKSEHFSFELILAGVIFGGFTILDFFPRLADFNLADRSRVDAYT